MPLTNSTNSSSSHTFPYGGTLPSSLLRLLPSIHPSSMLILLPSNLLSDKSLNHNQIVLVNNRICKLLFTERILTTNSNPLSDIQLPLLSPCLYHATLQPSTLVISSIPSPSTTASATITLAPIIPVRLFPKHAARIAKLAAAALKGRDVQINDIIPAAPRLFLIVTLIKHDSKHSDVCLYGENTRIAIQLAQKAGYSTSNIPYAMFEWTNTKWRSGPKFPDLKRYSNQLKAAVAVFDISIITLVGDKKDIDDMIDYEYQLPVRRVTLFDQKTIEKECEHGSFLLFDMPLSKDEQQLILREFRKLKEPLLSYHRPFADMEMNRDMALTKAFVISCRDETDLDVGLLKYVSKVIKVNMADETERKMLIQNNIGNVKIREEDLMELVRMSTSFARRYVMNLARLYEKKGMNGCKEGVNLFAKGRISVETGGVTWKDVGGMEKAKETITEMIDLSRIDKKELDKKKLRNRRVGVLLYGEPGTGKTLLARAIANESGFSFISVKGPELLDMYVGESEKNVREVFQRAKNAAPCVIFFDELDALAPSRGKGSDSGGVSDRVVSQLMAELDQVLSTGFDVFIIGASNRPDLVDQGLLRPGRLDKLVYVSMPQTRDEQLVILKAQTRKFRFDGDVDFKKVLEFLPLPPRISGADIYAMATEAWMIGAKRVIEEQDIYEDGTENEELVDELVIMKRRNIMEKRMESYERWFEGDENNSMMDNDDSLEEDEIEESIVCVSENDFITAAQNLTPSLSLEQLKEYQQLRKEIESR